MANPNKTYTIGKAKKTPEFKGHWDGPAWRYVPPVDIDNFHSRSSDHRPRAQAKMLYGEEGVYLIYRVEDRYVRSIHTKFQELVALYTCVEFFVQPKDNQGFFNFEFNCGGTLLCFYTYEWREEGGPNKYHTLTDEQCRQVKVYHSMPDVVDPAVDEPRDWVLEFLVPFTLLEQYVGPLGDVKGQAWHGNFYKCVHAEDAHPHWAAWAPVEVLNFHQPRCFGQLRFE
jgi:hypothetical protein